MKILLINPPIREDRPAYQEPIGLMSVGTFLKRGGHAVELLDLNAHRVPWEDLERTLPTDQYDVVGLSGLITTYRFLAHAVPVIRRVHHDAAIVVGGGGITSAPETYMENIRPDFGVLGEGEHTFSELLGRLASGETHRDVAGLVYSDGDVLRYGPPRAVEVDINKFYPLDWEMIDVDAYAKVRAHYPDDGRELSLLATRGCPMACNFCYHVFGRGYRWRDPVAVVDEMEMLASRYNIVAFLMGDECLTASRKYLTAFCTELINRKLGLHWSCFSRVDTVDANAMCLMRDAGCYMIGFGMESGSQKILDAMNKKTDIETMARADRYARRIFRGIGSTYIFGYPGEDDSTVEENIQFQERLGTYRHYFHLQPYPGTVVFEENKDKILRKYGTLDAFFRSLGDAGVPSINLTDWTDEVYAQRYKDLHRRLALSVVRARVEPYIYNAICS